MCPFLEYMCPVWIRGEPYVRGHTGKKNERADISTESVSEKKVQTEQRDI